MRVEEGVTVRHDNIQRPGYRLATGTGYTAVQRYSGTDGQVPTWYCPVSVLTSRWPGWPVGMPWPACRAWVPR